MKYLYFSGTKMIFIFIFTQNLNYLIKMQVLVDSFDPAKYKKYIQEKGNWKNYVKLCLEYTSSCDTSFCGVGEGGVRGVYSRLVEESRLVLNEETFNIVDMDKLTIGGLEYYNKLNTPFSRKVLAVFFLRKTLVYANVHSYECIPDKTFLYTVSLYDSWGEEGGGEEEEGCHEGEGECVTG